MTTINFNGEELRLVQSRYKNNDALYVGFADKDGEYYGDVTVNLPNSGTLPSDCAFLDTNNLTWRIAEVLIDAGIAQPICQSARSGFCTYYAFRFTKLSDIDDISVSVV